jgi:hypothetical protein
VLFYVFFVNSDFLKCSVTCHDGLAFFKQLDVNHNGVLELGEFLLSIPSNGRSLSRTTQGRTLESTFSVQAQPTSSPPGGLLQLSWTRPERTHSSDRIDFDLLKVEHSIEFDPKWGSTTMLWPLPVALPAGTYRIRAHAGASLGAAALSNFVEVTNKLKVTEPSNLRWTVPSMQEIRWRYDGQLYGNTVRLELWHNGSVVTTLADKTSASAGAWTWHISRSTLAQPDYTVRVIDVVVETNFAVSAPFSLLPVVDVTFPPPNFMLSPGSVFTLSWTVTGIGRAPPVRVRLCVGSNSAALTTLVTLTEGTLLSSLGWAVPPLNVTAAGAGYWLTFELLEAGTSDPVAAAAVPVNLQQVTAAAVILCPCCSVLLSWCHPPSIM